MILSKIYCKNYRCFGNTPTVIEFSESGLTALIGPNNVGKSTVLKMLEILLGDKWPTSQFGEDDFHENNFTNEIIIACEFSRTLNVLISSTQGAIDINGLVIRVKHLATGYGESSIDVEYKLLESTTDLENLNFEDLDVANYRNSSGRPGDKPIYISQEIRNQLPIVITIPLIKLHAEQPMNKWGVLGKMLQKVEAIFSEDEAKKVEFQGKIGDAVGVLRSPPEFQEIESDIKSFWDAMKPNNLSGTDLTFLDFDPWHYYRQFKLAIKRHGRDVPIETLGEGVQRLAIIALYRSYLRRHGRNAKAILLIEEPESYLHPQARKSLFTVLKNAIAADSDVEGQIIYTTHSEDFVDCGSFDDIVAFGEAEGNVSARHISEEILKDHTAALAFVNGPLTDQHIFYKLLENVTHGLKEALFASKAVIVEGPSEAALLSFTTSIDENQIAVVIAGGKGNIPAVYAFLTAFGIPSLIIIDRDENKVGENFRIVKTLTQPRAATPDITKMDITEAEISSVLPGDLKCKDRLLIFSKNLENVLASKIPEYEVINEKLRTIFGIPIDSKPRLVQALGLALGGNVGGDAELKAKLDNAKDSFQSFSNSLSQFVLQQATKPSILDVADESIPEINADDLPF